MKEKFNFTQNLIFDIIFPQEVTEQLNGSETAKVKQINSNWKNHTFQNHKKL